MAEQLWAVCQAPNTLVHQLLLEATHYRGVVYSSLIPMRFHVGGFVIRMNYYCRCLALCSTSSAIRHVIVNHVSLPRYIRSAFCYSCAPRSLQTSFIVSQFRRRNRSHWCCVSPVYTKWVFTIEKQFRVLWVSSTQCRTTSDEFLISLVLLLDLYVWLAL